MELLFIPAVLFIAGIILFINFKKIKKQFDNINSVERSAVSEIIENHDHFLIEFGKGTYQQYVELSGNVKCNSPLLAPISGQSCIYTDHQVIRKYETQVQERDPQGRIVTRTQLMTETVSSNKQSIPFVISDEDSEVEVLPEAAEIYPIRSHYSQQGILDPELAKKLGISDRYGMGRTTGFTLIENIIPLGQPLYVLGEANDRTGQLAVSKPRDNKQSFILSTSHEDVLLQKLSVKLKWFRIGFWAAFMVGIIIFVIILYSLLNAPLP